MRGHIRIIVAYDEVQEKLTFHIVDTGRGIKQNEMGQLFKQFGKIWRTAGVNSEGIGMGLMICQNLVKANQGAITVFSEGVNKGSTFSFSFSAEPFIKN